MPADLASALSIESCPQHNAACGSINRGLANSVQAVSAAVALVDAVCENAPEDTPGATAGPCSHARAGFGLIRPPGHHATRDEVSGFCMLNNIAIAARHAQKAHGIEKVCQKPFLLVVCGAAFEYDLQDIHRHGDAVC